MTKLAKVSNEPPSGDAAPVIERLAVEVWIKDSCCHRDSNRSNGIF